MIGDWLIRDQFSLSLSSNYNYNTLIRQLAWPSRYMGCSISSWPNIEGITVAPIFSYHI